jgi:hypothetical protein
VSISLPVVVGKYLVRVKLSRDILAGGKESLVVFGEITDTVFIFVGIVHGVFITQNGLLKNFPGFLAEKIGILVEIKHTQKGGHYKIRTVHPGINHIERAFKPTLNKRIYPLAPFFEFQLGPLQKDIPGPHRGRDVIAGKSLKNIPQIHRRFFIGI